MRHFCVIGFLSVTLCVMGCLFVNASEPENIAKKAVDDAQKSVNTVFERAKSELSQAKHMLGQAKVFKRRAELATENSASAAKGYAEAEAIAIKIKNLSNSVTTLYPTVNGQLERAVTDFENLLLEAKKLKERPKIKISPNDPLPNDYTDTNNKASELQKEAEILNTKISEVFQPMTDVYSTVNYMEKLAEEAKLANYHVRTLVAVIKINTMVKDAEVITWKTEQKRDEINDTVKEMNGLSTEHSPNLIFYLHSLCRIANGDLTYASSAVEKAQNAKEDMLNEKALADAALESVTKLTVFAEALKEVQIAESCVTKVEKIVPELKSALHTTEICVTSANSQKEEAVRALSNSNSEPGTRQSKVTEKTNLPKEEGTERNPQGEKEKPTITNTVQPMDKELIRQSDNKPENIANDTREFPKKDENVKQTTLNVNKMTVQTPETSMHQASYQPVIVRSDQPKDKYSEIQKDELRKGKHNETEIPLIGGKVPALGAESDSSLTVTVSLLMVLITTAVF